ncbi:uncharacterized protein LOC119732856 [Patiria miniata]|uniref:Uncharacterized protein n=1 Tax=Patiria miniata TaxID=46514 RepID=A0A914AEL5_PATMI|nr:uncharacterized protein LOC119732856 [Patiria miniata]
MSAMNTPSKTGKESESPAKDAGEYLSALAGGKSPISLPSIPAWMLNTPMYSKLPMIPAPKGKITLYTTGLGEKLYPTPNDLDFDPSAEGLSSEYKTLHDPHLKSHYTQPATLQGLIRRKFVTPEGKVICTLKEFNDYHQYLKRVHIEKCAQDRKSIAMKERKERERQRQEWTMKEGLSPHDKQVLETQTRKRKTLKEHHRHLLQRLEEDTVKHLRVLEEKQTKRSIERARRNLEREKKRNKRLRWELEEHIKKGTKRMNLAEDEIRHAELLKCYNVSVTQRRELKLEDQWNRHQKIREKHRLEAARRRKEQHTRFAQNIDSREQTASDKWSKQLSTFDNMREARALKMQRQEAKIEARLEKKLKSVRKLFEQRRRKPIGGRRRRPPRHGLGGPRHYSTWPVEHALDRIELSPADGVWKIITDRYLPTAAPTTSPAPSPTGFLEPTITIETEEKLPISKDILAEIAEEESVPDVQEDRGYSISSIEMAVLFGDHYDSFIASARDLVGNVLHALEAERRSEEHVPEAVESVVTEPKETKLPEVMRRKSVLQLTNSTVARLVLSNVLSRAKEQITTEGGLPHLPIATPTRKVASDTIATKKPSVGKQASLREIHPPSPIAKSGVMSDGSIQPKETPSPKHTSSSLLAAALVSDALRKVTRELEEESQRSDTSVFVEDMVWDTIRNVTGQLQKELSENVSRELEQESQRSDTSILAEDVVQNALRNVTSQLQKELTESGTSFIAQRVVSDAIRNAARQLREMRLTQSSSSVLAEELASTAIRDATRQLQVLLPQTSSSIIAEAIAADAIKSVMRQFGAQPPQTSSSILAQAFAADALKNATRRLEGEQIVRALHQPVHASSSLLAQAITNDTIKKVTRQLQLEREALIPHTSSSLLAQAVTNDALANAARQLEHEPRVPPPHSDSSLLAQVVTREVLLNGTVRLQVEKLLQTPQTDSSTVAQQITIDALQNAAAQLPENGAQLSRTSSSRLAQITADAALQAAKEQLRTDRASSRCRSRGSRSSSPFSPDLAKSAVNQTSPEPTKKGTKTRAVASDIIKRAAVDMESQSPTNDLKTPSPLPGQVAADSPDLELDVDDTPDQEFDGLSCQAQTIVMHLVDGAIASYQPKDEEDIEEENELEKSIDVHRSSLLLATVNDVFRESETDVSHHHHSHSAASESEGSDSEEEVDEEDEIIGVIENEIIAEEESVHSLAECLDGSKVEGLTSVVKKSHDKTVFEGAIIPHDKAHESVTEKVLSVEELHKDESGHLVHDASSKSIHKVAEGGESSQEQIHQSRHHYSSIVPIYHTHPLNLDKEIIAHNLSAISMKPDNKHKVPSAFSASSRNSFRNMFRPDMTHCQGSAKCLKDTLVKELSHSQHGQHDQIYGVLEQPHEDITAHHSDEELVGQEEVGGVCYLPQRRRYRTHEVMEDVVAEEQDEVVEEGGRVSPEASQETKDTPAGGDFKSPTEEEVEPILPMSRASTRSIRSGKSREIKSFQSKTESQEESASPSTNKSPTKDAAKSKSTTETKTSSQVPASRSVIGAVIERISSIFGRKHSTKIHPWSTDDHTAEVTSSQTQSRDQSSIKPDTGGKTVDQAYPFEKSDTKRELSDAEVADVQSTPASAKVADEDPDQNHEIQSTKKENTDVYTEKSVETSEVDAIHIPEKTESEPSGERIEPIGPNKQAKQREAVRQPTTDMNKIAEAGTGKEAEKETTKADKTIIKSIELPPETQVRSPAPCTGPEIVQPGGDKVEDAGEKSSPVQRKSSERGEKKKRDSKKSHKSGSESSLKEGQGRKSKTPKPSLSGPLTRPVKSSSAAFGRRSQQRSLTSASPKPRACASSPQSTKAHLGHAKISTQSSQQQMIGSEKAPSLAKPSSGSSMPCVVKQRSQVTKPPSTGSIRLIKVSPAPSMSSARRRSGKLSSTSVGKLMSDKASGGSVRLIKVSPAASTVIGPRRSSRQSTSGAVVKASASSSSNSSPIGVQKLSRDKPKSVSRKASRGSVQSPSKARVLSIKSPQASRPDEAKQAGLVGSRPSSTGSFVIIKTPQETPSTKDNTIASCEPDAVTEAPSQHQESTEQEQAKTDSVQEPLPQSEVVNKEGERQEKAVDAATEESPIGNEEPDMPVQESQTGQPQQLEEPLVSERESDEPKTPVSSPAGNQLAERSCDSSGSQSAKASRRSKSIISAVIERLSRMFSGEYRVIESSIEERHRSDTQMGARSRAGMQGGDEGKVRHSQSTDAVLHTQSTPDGKKNGIQTHSRQRKSSKSVVVRDIKMCKPSFFIF